MLSFSSVSNLFFLCLPSRICLYQTFSPKGTVVSLQGLPLLLSHRVLPSTPTKYLEATIAAHLMHHGNMASVLSIFIAVLSSICNLKIHVNSLIIRPAPSTAPFDSLSPFACDSWTTTPPWNSVTACLNASIDFSVSLLRII